MTINIDYYFAPQSPWTYLGHLRLVELAKVHGATVRVMPVDLGGQVFPVSGGLPLAQRAPQRLTYRLVELTRWAQHLGLALNLKPQFFPVAGDDAARLIIAIDQYDGSEAAMKLAGAVLAAVWEQERNIADSATLTALLSESGLRAGRLAQSRNPSVQARYAEYTQAAIAAHVFGAPTYVVDGELFWGQDRLDFVERKLLSLKSAA
jgi:2-hydroxychromene-2-carboxylate isomerase